MPERLLEPLRAVDVSRYVAHVFRPETGMVRPPRGQRQR
jgi:hypothetical protein